MNKLIFISNSLADIENTKLFAKKNSYSLEHYSKEEWKSKKRVKTGRATKARHLSIVPDPVQNPLFSPTIGEIKEKAINKALLMSRGNVRQAAEMLGLGRATMYRKVQEMDIDLESIRAEVEETEYQVLKKAS